MAINIGIDLGTTNSCISYLEGKEMMVIPNPEGSRVIPSIIALDKTKKRIFGNIAKRQFITNNENTIWGVKRLMGAKFGSNEADKMSQRVTYKIVKSENDDAHIMFGDKMSSPQELSGMFLKYLKDLAEDYLGEDCGSAVITVPAFFNDSQRQATKLAGELAGLNVSRIINEPTAALIAYGEKIKKDGFYAVYDLGGGTFDISIVEVTGDIYKVVSTFGDTFLGGSDFDVKIIEWIINEVEKDISTDITGDKNSLQRILQSSEKAKIELSFNEETLISIPYLYHSEQTGNYHFQKKLTRTQLEIDTMPLIDKTIELVKQSLDEVNMTPEQIEGILLVGGQSRMPLIIEKIKKLFNKEPLLNLNPEEVVAQGAALQAMIIDGKMKDLLLLDVTPLSIGLETKDNTYTKLIEKNSTIPIKKSMIFTTIVDSQTTVKIHVLQGERTLASENRSLGYFNLVGIPMAPKGIPQIEVSFEIDSNGIVKVSAIDKKTSLSQYMEIQPASGLSPEEIERIMEDSAKYLEQDKKTAGLIKTSAKLKEEIESITYFFNQHNQKFGLKEKSDIKNLLSRSEKALDDDADLDVLLNLLNRAETYRIKINQLLVSEFDEN